MKKIFTICFYLIFISSLRAQVYNPAADSSGKPGLKIKSCFANPDHNNFNEHSKNSSIIKIKGVSPLEWIERNNLLEFIEDKYFLNKKMTVQFIGDASIDRIDVINYNILVFNGTLTINKKVYGSVAGVNSKIIIKEDSAVSESVILFNSTVTSDSNYNLGNVVCGDLSDFDRNVIPFYSSFSFKHPRFKYSADDYPGQGLIRYNRVEGLYMGLNSDKKYYWNGRKNGSYYGFLGYGFGNHRWNGSIGYDRWFGNNDRVEIGGEAHSLTDSKDNWKINSTENSLAAFFIHEDYKDYFLRDGWSIHSSKYFDQSTVIDLKYAQDNYRSQTRNNDWALFGGDKEFRYNPPVNEGILKSVIFSFNHVTTNQKDYMPNGWDISFNYEKAMGISSFNRIFLDVRKYLYLANNNHLSIRVMAGSADNYLPWQKSFEIGGLGTVPAARYNSLSGNRMLLANIDYSIPLLEVFTEFFDWNNYSHTGIGNLILSYDAGYADESASKNLFKGFNKDKNSSRQDFGVAFGFNRNKFRIGAAFRIDKSEPAQFVFRVCQPF